MQYTIEEITNGVAKVRWSDGTYSFTKMTADMTEADLDDLVYAAAPGHLMTGEAPSFVTTGMTRTAAKKPVEAVPDPEESDPAPEWLINRLNAYGNIAYQLEYITENGLDAWQAHVAQIKADNPKPSE